MRIWLITVGEPLPVDGHHERLLRTGILAELLVRQGHEVVWWTSSFDHVRKQLRCQGDRQILVAPCYSLWLLNGCGYSSNLSLRRILNHRQIARSFDRLARHQPRPDIILCSWPTVELCVESVRFGKQWGIPVVLDVRDLWPNAISDLAPRILRPAARFAFRGAFRSARYAASRATGITGITKEYVEWGVKYAQRAPTEFDCEFPLGYVDRPPTAGEIRVAEDFWSTHGITRDSDGLIACWFGMFGRLSEMPTVLEAARRLELAGKRVKFVLCGVGPQLPRYRRLAEGCPNVVFPGWVNATQIWTMLRIASVGLAPYVSSENYRRNIPNKPVEYLSAGLPIISSLKGVLARLLSKHDCGVTYENGCSEELARELANLDSPQLQRMSKNAQSLYRSEFVAENVYSRMHSYLSEMVDTFTQNNIKTGAA